MSRSQRSIQTSHAKAGGFTLLELLISMGLTISVMVAVTGMFEATGRYLRNQQLDIETTQAARAAIDSMVRDLRLSGACLPITGDFIALAGTSSGTTDSITTRAGIVRPDMSCVNTATTSKISRGSTSIVVQNVNGFSTGLRGYIRSPAGTGEFFTITGVNTSTKTLTRNTGAAAAYASTSGVYAVDERIYSIGTYTSSFGTTPALMLQLNGGTAQPFAVGIEALNVTYQLNSNCPSCIVESAPSSASTDWRLVQEIFVTLTARSDRLNQWNQYYRRTLSVGVKPRNLLPTG